MLELTSGKNWGGGGGNNCQSVVEPPPETQAKGVLPACDEGVARSRATSLVWRAGGATCRAPTAEDALKSVFLARTGDSDEMIWFRTAILGGVI
jgi:hypothetical protein